MQSIASKRLRTYSPSSDLPGYAATAPQDRIMQDTRGERKRLRLILLGAPIPTTMQSWAVSSFFNPWPEPDQAVRSGVEFYEAACTAAGKPD